MNDRDCDNCVHHSDGGCSVWECSFEQKDDTISRQAAIGALCGECQANCIPCESFPCGEIKAVQELSPAQPEIITCTECKYYDTDTEQCNNDKGLRFIDFGNPERMWCSWAERREE